jgi:hypothetical protein
MNNKDVRASLVLGAFICVGLIVLGYLLASSATKIRALSRTVEVKGLSEREVPANVAIWPIKYREADNDLNALYSKIQRNNTVITDFLKERGFEDDEIFMGPPAVVDKLAQEYSQSGTSQYRYSGGSTISVYTENVDLVRNTMEQLVELGKVGIAITGETYDARTQFLFTKLNDLKPEMVEEATKNAREVAEKFAEDSKSKLGKIRRASQGLFSIEDRDVNTPYIKKVRVVSTVEYYLAD